METVKAKLSQRIKRTDTVESFRFNTEKKIDFIAGQFLQVILDPLKPGDQNLSKYLSLSCSPFRQYIEVTKRLSQSHFSQKLQALKAGDEILLKGPTGNCVFKDEFKKIGFLIGGIGITPVISILEYIIDKKLSTDALVFYSNRSDTDIAFRKELDGFQSQSSGIKVFYTVTDCPSQDNSCIFGRIDKDLMLGRIKDYGERRFFIFGPPKMVDAMQGICYEIGCNKDNVKTENFVGY